MRRFGELRSYKDGEMLFETGKPGPGMFVVLSGHVAITQRDGLGHVTPVIDQGPGQFLAEIGQLSGRVALVDGHAEGDVETLLIPPEQLRALLVAEADLGERIMRALILRRVSLIQGGAGGPVLIGPPDSAGVMRLQSFLTRNGYPHHLLDPVADSDAAELIARYSPSPADLPLVVCPDGTVLRNPARSRTRARDRHDRRPGQRQALRRRRSSAAVRPGLPTAVYAASEGLVGGGASMRARSAARPAPARASRTISAFRPAFPARRWPGAPSTRRRSSAPTCMIPVAVKSLDCCARRRRLRAWRLDGGEMLRARSVVVASGARYRRPEIENLDDFEGRGVWYWASPIEARLCAEPGRRPGRRRQFRRPGRGVPVGPRPQGSHDDPRRRPRRQHVALSDRAHRGDAEYRTDVQHRGGRRSKARGRLAGARALAQPSRA